MGFGQRGTASRNQIFVPINGLSMITAHEVVHAISVAIGDGFAFWPFEEGLAQVVQVLHNFYDRDRFGWAYQVWPILVEGFIPRYYGYGVYASYEIASAVRNFLLKDYENVVPFYHFLAYTALNAPPGLGTALPYFRQRHGSPSEIHTLYTAHSFVMYLIETYGTEQYFLVHFDMYPFEYVYGMTLQEMIKEWMDFLSVAAGEFLYAAMQAQ